MSLDSFDDQCIEPGLIKSYVKFTGTGASAVVKNFGRGMQATRTGVGVINLVWDESPGTYMGVIGWCYEAPTQAALKGYTVVAAPYVVATRTITINITNSTDTLADLAVLQQLSLTIGFKRTNA